MERNGKPDEACSFSFGDVSFVGRFRSTTEKNRRIINGEGETIHSRKKPNQSLTNSRRDTRLSLRLGSHWQILG